VARCTLETKFWRFPFLSTFRVASSIQNLKNGTWEHKAKQVDNRLRAIRFSRFHRWPTAYKKLGNLANSS
ncbi:MAG: hypothetical protein ACXACI_11005, partial [Candidatus Hodarchaeales archaeon]